MFNKKEEVLIPKFHVGDIVWFIEYEKVVSKKITGVFYETKDINRIRYSFDEKPSEYNWKNQDLLFVSKQSLIDSL